MTGETVLLSVAMDVAAGLVGSFAVMRHMSLAADPRSHIALPGSGLALALHAQPIFGAVVALLVGAVCWSGPSRREQRQPRRPSSESSFPPRSRLEALRPRARTSSMRSSEIR